MNHRARSEEEAENRPHVQAGARAEGRGQAEGEDTLPPGSSGEAGQADEGRLPAAQESEEEVQGREEGKLKISFFLLKLNALQKAFGVSLVSVLK